ncbi:Ohr family peroxiredoxin [Streptomyces sp. PA03-1a]|nr:Ohr family peroxiredoxin [Streptomyces sp. PA03-1a]MDX2814135.1 Ohr family peroxiredoxin [Streptomyces sp. PA03-5A]
MIVTETHYTAVVTATGEGRNGGRAASSDGHLDLTLAVPEEFGGNGGATNPEQLLAAGWASCFLGAVKITAAQRKVRVPDVAVVAEVTLHHRHEQGDYGLSAVLHLEVGGVDQKTADELGAGAHQICPYSKALAIPVTVEATVV